MVASFDLELVGADYQAVIVLSEGKASERILMYCPYRLPTLDHVATIRRLFETYGYIRSNYRIREGKCRHYVTLHDREGGVIMEGAAESYDSACYTIEKCIESFLDLIG